LSGFAHGQTPDRRALVTAAHRVFPSLATFVASLKTTEDWPQDERRVLEAVRKVAYYDRPPLEFVDDPKAFIIDGMEKVMISDEPKNSPIYVNTTMLNLVAEGGRLSGNEILKVILTTLFHEHGHKIGEPNLSLRDRAASRFAQTLAPFIRAEPLGDQPNARLILLSLPQDLVETQLNDADEMVQPTFLILHQAKGIYTDLTPAATAGVTRSMDLLAPLMTELSRKVYQFVGGIQETIAQAFQQFMSGSSETARFFAELRRMGLPVDEIAEMATSTELRELQVLQLLQMRSVVVRDEIYVSLDASYMIGRTMRSRMTVRAEGFPLPSDFKIPLQISFRLPLNAKPNLDSVNFNVEYRPLADYANAAKISSVLRQGTDVNFLKVELPPNTTTSVQLRLRYNAGYLLIEPVRVKSKDGLTFAEFEIPPYIMASSSQFVAESVLIGGQDTVYLDRLIPLSGESQPDRGVNAPSEHRNPILLDTVGLWGSQDNQPQFRRHFEYQDPVIMMEHLTSDRFSLDPQNLPLEFQIQPGVRIREIRLHVQRTFIVTGVEPSARVDHVPVRGPSGETFKLPFVGEGTFNRTYQEFEVATLRAPQIFKSDLDNGNQLVRATFTLPFRMRGSLKDREGFAPPFGQPALVEIVTDDLKIHRVYFTKVNEVNCDASLVGNREGGAEAHQDFAKTAI